MRLKLLVGVVVGLAAVGSARAQSLPQEATIIVPEVEVRCGPTSTFYPTSKLVRGDRVVVLREAKEQPGWLEIKPPQGSFSWIDAKEVAHNGPYAVVNVQPGRTAKVLVGSSLINRKPDVEKDPGFVAGYIAKVVDKPLQADGSTWLPVEPHPAEVRYIPADAVRPTQVASNSPTNWTLPAGQPAGVQSPNRPVGGTTTAFSPSPPPNSPPPSAMTMAAQWSSYGTLRSTTIPAKDGQPIYALVNAKEQPIMYVTTRAGMSLRTYVGQTIAVYGPVVYESDQYSRRQYIVATHLVAAP